MLDPDALYTVAPDVEVPGQLVLLHALDGFIDAAGAVRRARDHLLGAYDHQVVVSFDADQLVDYRSRRPPLLFDRDHWAAYTAPELSVHLLRDDATTGAGGSDGGEQFLLLTGPEPDVHWERFAAAVAQLVERLGIRLTIGMDAIPLSVPHTRPIGLTLHGSRPELLGDHEPWLDQVQVPGSAGHLLEFRLGQLGLDSMGLAVHVPQYLAQSEFPGASGVLLDAISRATGLHLPTEALHAAGKITLAQIDEQVSQSEEVSAVVHQLEAQYDTFIAGRGDRLDRELTLPSADELGARFERFLAEQRDAGNSPEV